MTDTDCKPWMFLVHKHQGKKPRVYQLHPYEVLEHVAVTEVGWLPLARRRPRAWRIGLGAVAAIGNSVDEAHELAGKLLGELETV